MNPIERKHELFEALVKAGSREKLGKGWLELAIEYNMNADIQSPVERKEKVRARWRSFKRTAEYEKMKERLAGIRKPKSFTESEQSQKAEQNSTDEANPQFFYSLNKKQEFIVLDQYSSYPMTEEEMYAFHKVDPDVWMTHEQEATVWEQGAKIQFDGQWMIAKTPLHRYKIKWRLRKDSIAAIKEMLISNIVLPEFQPQKIKTNGKICVEMMITDHHLGKVGFDPETMEFNWTIKEAAQAYSDAIDHFLSEIDPDDIGQIVLPTGNDLINIDNSFNTTTAGTPQMTGEFWESVFRYGKELLFATIEKTSKIAPTHVYMVRGNHDKNSVFSLGEAVDSYFKGNPNVIVNNPIVKRNYHEWGKCMIGYTHGNQIKKNDAYKALSLDEPQMFGRTKYRALHMGHLHTRRLKRVMEIEQNEEVNGVDVEICPSLCPTDRWHSDSLYIGNVRRSKAFYWHKDKGMIKETYYNL